MTSRQYYIPALEKQLWTLWPSSKWKAFREAMGCRKPYPSSGSLEDFFFFPELKNGQDHIHLPHMNLSVLFSLRANHSGLKLKIPPLPRSDGSDTPIRSTVDFWHKTNYVQALEPFSSNKLQEEKIPFPICVTPCSHCIIILFLCLYLPCLKVTGLTGSQLAFWYTLSLPQCHSWIPLCCTATNLTCLWWCTRYTAGLYSMFLCNRERMLTC